MAQKNYDQKGTFTVAQVGVFPIKESIKNMEVKDPNSQYFGKKFNEDKTHTIAVKFSDFKVNDEIYAKWITIGHRKFKDGDEECWRQKFGNDWKPRD